MHNSLTSHVLHSFTSLLNLHLSTCNYSQSELVLKGDSLELSQGMLHSSTYCCADKSDSSKPEQEDGHDNQSIPKMLMVRTENLKNNPFEQTQETKVCPSTTSAMR